MKVKTVQLLTLERIVNKYAGEKSAKVAWMFARNRSIIAAPLKDFREIVENTPAMDEFAKARAELGKEFADRDADGAPKQEMDRRTGQLRFSISRLGAFSEAAEKMLKEKFPQAEIDQKEIDEKSKELLDEELDIDLYQIELSKIPGFRDEKDEANGIIESADLSILFEMGIVYEKVEANETKLGLVEEKKVN